MDSSGLIREHTATGICVTFRVDTDAERGGAAGAERGGGGDKEVFLAKYLAARALQIEVWCGALARFTCFTTLLAQKKKMQILTAEALRARFGTLTRTSP